MTEIEKKYVWQETELQQIYLWVWNKDEGKVESNDDRIEKSYKLSS